MAINIQQELERLYQQNQQQGTGLSDRLNQLDQYAGQVNPMVRSQMLDFSNRPQGYNPLQDIQSAIDFSERSRDARTATSQDVERNQNTGVQLLNELDQMAQRSAAGSDKLSPHDQMVLDLQKAAALEDIKQGKLRFNSTTGQLEATPANEVSEPKKEVLNVIDKLLGKNTKPITGALQIESMIPGSKAKLTEALYNQLKGMLSLENRQQLKGSGAISDYEFKVLGQAAAALDRNMSDDDFRQMLSDLRAKLAGKEPSTQQQTKQDKTKDPLGIL